jgi:import inner membrane translocase subunit TIM23
MAQDGSYTTDGGDRPLMPAGAIDPRILAPMLGRFDQLGSTPGADYLEVPGLANPNDPRFRRSWGERLIYNTGRMYLAGLVGGGSYGLYAGLRESSGQLRRLRINAVLNSTNRFGPNLGNQLGAVALIFSVVETLATTVRDEQDIFNPMGAGFATGLLYKMSAGPRAAVLGGLVGGGLVTAVTLAGEQLGGVFKNL